MFRTYTSYDKGITFNGEIALQYSFANLYYSINNSGNGVIYVAYQNKLSESYFILIAYILVIIAEALIAERTKLINIRGYSK